MFLKVPPSFYVKKANSSLALFKDRRGRFVLGDRSLKKSERWRIDPIDVQKRATVSKLISWVTGAIRFFHDRIDLLSFNHKRQAICSKNCWSISQPCTYMWSPSLDEKLYLIWHKAYTFLPSFDLVLIETFNIEGKWSTVALLVSSALSCGHKGHGIESRQYNDTSTWRINAWDAELTLLRLWTQEQ